MDCVISIVLISYHYMKKFFFSTFLFSSLFLVSFITTSFFTGCGGGGGGDTAFFGAALVNIDATPRLIDPADRTKVTVRIDQAHENGVLLKVRYPNELKYVIDSAFINSDGSKKDISPVGGEQAGNRDNFLAFCFLPRDFQERSTNFTFELVGVGNFSKGKIEIDPDVKTTEGEDSCVFNVADPQFSAEDEVEISVRN